MSEPFDVGVSAFEDREVVEIEPQAKTGMPMSHRLALYGAVVFMSALVAGFDFMVLGSFSGFVVGFFALMAGVVFAESEARARIKFIRLACLFVATPLLTVALTKVSHILLPTADAVTVRAATVKASKPAPPANPAYDRSQKIISALGGDGGVERIVAVLAPVVEKPGDYNPSVFLAAAQSLFDEDYDKEGFFWALAGILLANQDAAATESGAAASLVAGITDEMCRKLGGSAKTFPDEFKAAAASVLAWEPTLKRDGSRDWITNGSNLSAPDKAEFVKASDAEVRECFAKWVGWFPDNTVAFSLPKSSED